MANISAVSQAQGVPVAALCQALSLPRSSYYRSTSEQLEKPRRSVIPSNALSDKDRQDILALLHSERFVDCTPLIKSITHY